MDTKKQDKNERNLEYERKFKAYLFRGNWERHLKICDNINVVESTPKTRGEEQ